MNRAATLLLLLFTTCLSVLGQSMVHPTERWISSLHGVAGANNTRPLAANKVLLVRDPELNYQLAYPTTYTARYEHRTSEAVVALRFNDTDRGLYTTAWTATVNYILTTRDINGTVTVHPTASIAVNYDPALSYTDIKEVYHAKATWASLKVTSVSLTGGMAVPNDLYLDLRLDVDRHYDLTTTEKPSFTYKGLAAGDNTHYNVRWNYVEGAEAYDFEWVFVDTEGIMGSTTALPYDFANATRITTTHNQYEIPLAYTKGTLLWRVRAVGLTALNGVREEGPWNDPQTGGTLVLGNVASSSLYRYDFTGLQESMNWQYSASYAEQGKRKELLTTFDGGLRPRQSMTLLNTEQYALLDQKIYDFLGRPSLQLLPYPVNDRKLGFKTNQALVGGTQYDWQDFDTDGMVNAPATFTGVGAGHYYSTANSNGLGFMGKLAPDAQGRPYSRVTYWNDGTGRVREQAGPGPDHTMGSGHTTTSFYGTPGSQYELDRLFGNEVGYVQHYKKNLVVDPNGVTTVSYLDPYGRTIATALAGFPDTSDPLAPVDGYLQGDITKTVNADIPSAEDLNGDWSVNKTFTLNEHGPVTFTYNLGGATYNGCVTGDCAYDITIRLKDDCGSVVDLIPGNSTFEPAEFTCLDCENYSPAPFTVDIGPGVFTIEKVVHLREETLSDAALAFDMATPPGCIPPPVVEEIPCEQTCEEICTDAYQQEIDGVLWWLDELGTPVSPTSSTAPGYDATLANAVTILYNQCVLDCDAPAPDECTIKLGLLKMDMSPGGQYFENLAHEDDPNDAYILNTMWDDWLVVKIGATPPSITNCSLCTSWQYVKDNWQDEFANDLVEFHPEYCQYTHYCETTCSNETNSCGGPYITEPFYGSFYNAMFDHEDVAMTDPTWNYLWNPLHEAQVPSATDVQYQPVLNTLTGDELLVCWSCRQNDCAPPNLDPTISAQMRRFLPINGVSGVYDTDFYSIWYVLNVSNTVPVGLGGAGYGVGPVDDFFAILYGTNNDGLVSADPTPGPTQVTAYQFFRSYYNFLREHMAYQGYNNDCSPQASAAGCQDMLESPNNDGQTSEGYLIRYPQNPVFATWPNVDDFVTTLIPNTCQLSCEAAADLQIASLQECDGTITTCCYTSTELADLREDLINVCKLGCTSTDLTGSSLGDGGTTSITSTCTVQPLFNFQEVIDCYLGSACTTAITYPAPAPPDPAAQCVCDNFNMLVNSQEVTTYTEFNTAMEELEASPAYTDQQFHDWLDACTSSPVDGIVAATLPDALNCASTEPVASNCQSDADALANYNAMVIWQQAFDAARLAFLGNVRAACLADMASREEFTMEYELNEYHYTLYYYDQAGNLVKTVPPAGVNLGLSQYQDFAGTALTVAPTNEADLVARVANGRTTGQEADFIRPGHSMVTWYTYNSFQQPVAQHNPDGGTTTFYYDQLGRLVASQDATQEPADQYSYTLYDGLGRIAEVGQLTSPVVLTENIARKADATYTAGFQNIASPGTSDFFSTRTAVEQVTRTYYDRSMAVAFTGFQVLDDIQTAFGSGGAQNLRNRVASTTFAEGPFVNNGTPIPATTFDQATHYSYDIHGNVDVLLQDIRELEGLGQRLKRMDYEYDLLSGNVHQVSYQAGQWDEFHHRYRYDADNRLLDVRTSRDGRIWERDARYFYYAHGPLARTELGDKQVQGTDHFYTIQGWLKGVNSVRLTAGADAGQDAKTTGLNKPFALDAMGYVLRYHGNDYSPVGGAGANTMLPAMSTGTYATAFAPRQLYNGNIPSMLTALQDLTGTNLNLHANVYRYDLLNRIKGQTVYKGANSGTDLSNLNSNNEYGTSYDFDPNGNFDRHERRGNLGGTLLMDGLQYWYLTEANALYTPAQATLPSDRTNKLAYVVDNAGATTYPDDLESQSAGNYAYDAQGRLTQDILAGISAIAWNLQDKVRTVSRASTNASAPDLEFRYGAIGHRTVKVVKPRVSTVQQPASQWERTYYIHDAQGNPMAIYHRTYQANGGTSYTDRFMQEDALIYGSARLGNWHGGRLKTRGLTSATTDMTSVTYGSAPDWTNGQGGYPTTALSVTRELGLRHYELSNHLGNVLSTVSDRRLAVASGSVLAYYRADGKSYADYDPYGMLLPGRLSGSFADQKFGFQGQLKDDEVYGSPGTAMAAEFWEYDTKTGRRWNMDPVVKCFESPFAAFANNPIWFCDPNGQDSTMVNGTWYWKVQKGDTYSSISKRTGVNNDLLTSTNSQDARSLQIGSLLSISGTPTHFIYEASTPVIYHFTSISLKLMPAWKKLTYAGRSKYEAQKIRNQACGSTSCIKGVTECDEFPYANTIEGGIGALTTCAPNAEQRIQGGQLGGFGGVYRKLSVGQQFNIELVPMLSPPVPSLVPVPVDQPQPKEIPQPYFQPYGPFDQMPCFGLGRPNLQWWGDLFDDMKSWDFPEPPISVPLPIRGRLPIPR